MDLFQTACRATAPLTLDVERPDIQGVDRRRLMQPFALIGRDERADIFLDHDLVSRRHTYLQVVDGRLLFVDLESREGTLYGGGPVDSGWLNPGEALRIGPYALRLTAPVSTNLGFGDDDFGAAINPMSARPSSSDVLPKVTLEFQCRRAGRSVWRMTQALALLGSSPRCKVRLLDSNVSKLHCALLRTPQGLWAIDLLGRGGITVNDRPVRSAPLGPGDVLGMGDVAVRPNFEGQAVALPARRGRSAWPSPAAPRPVIFPALAAPATVAEPPATDSTLTTVLGHFAQMQQQQMDQFQQMMMMMMQTFHGMHQEQMGLVREELDRLRELNTEVASIKAQLALRPPAVPAPPPPASPPPASTFAAPAPPRPAPGPRPPLPSRPPNAPAVGSPGVEAHDWLSDRLAAITEEQQTRWQRVMSLVRGGKEG